MKGQAIEIEGKTYTRSQFHDLPHDLNLADASKIILQNGVLFQGHFSAISNFHLCEIVDDEDSHIKYTSSEQMIARARAIEANELSLAEDIMQVHNPYNIKRISKRIPITAGWKRNYKKIIKLFVRMKLQPNPRIWDALVHCPETKFYEATHDPTYRAGITLSQAHLVSRPDFKLPKRNRNVMSNIVTELRGFKAKLQQLSRLLCHAHY